MGARFGTRRRCGWFTGFIELKTHAKVSRGAWRLTGGKLRTYTHFGTGNYHPQTAKIYTDLSLFSADAALGRDATQLFNYITGYAEPIALEKIAISPLTLRGSLMEHIDTEIPRACPCGPAGRHLGEAQFAGRRTRDRWTLPCQPGRRAD